MRPPKRQPPPDFATNSDCCPHPSSSTDDCHPQSKVAASLTRFSSLFHPRHGIHNPPAETFPAFALCKIMKYYASTFKNPRGNISHKRIPTHLNEYCCFPLQWITPCPCPPRTLPGAAMPRLPQVIPLNHAPARPAGSSVEMASPPPPPARWRDD